MINETPEEMRKRLYETDLSDYGYKVYLFTRDSYNLTEHYRNQVQTLREVLELEKCFLTVGLTLGLSRTVVEARIEGLRNLLEATTDKWRE